MWFICKLKCEKDTLNVYCYGFFFAKKKKREKCIDDVFFLVFFFLLPFNFLSNSRFFPTQCSVLLLSSRSLALLFCPVCNVIYVMLFSIHDSLTYQRGQIRKERKIQNKTYIYPITNENIVLMSIHNLTQNMDIPIILNRNKKKTSLV